MNRILKSAAGLAFVLGMSASSASYAQDKVTFNMSWLPQGSVVGVAVAIDKGWLKEAGIDAKMVRGYGGNRTANELDQGQFEVGYVDPISLILNRKNGGKIKLIGAINTEWPGGICYNAKRGKITSLDQFKGLKLGGGSFSPVHNVVPAWLEMNGKPKDSIRLLRLDPAVVDASLVEGKIDLAECWRASNRAVMMKQAKIADVDLAWVEYSDFGLNSYGSSFAASEALIAKKPEMLRKFLKAAYRGYEFARSNSEAAADILVKMFPTLDRAVVLQQVKEIGVLIVDKKAADKGPGFLRDDKMKSTLEFVDKAYGVEGKVQLGDIYTNALLK